MRWNENPCLVSFGVYLEGWGGERIEDDCLITEKKCLPLNKSTKELITV